MFEDSMKNVRACAALGIGTVLIAEGHGGEAALLEDFADAEDPAVDAVLTSISDMRVALPSLWQRTFKRRGR